MNLTKSDLDMIQYSTYQIKEKEVNKDAWQKIWNLRMKISKKILDIEEAEKAAYKENLRLSISIGMGATVCGWSDKYAGTIIYVNDAKTEFIVQKDEAKLTNAKDLKVSAGGFCAHTEGVQEYEYKEDKNGSRYQFTLRKNGKFVEKGHKMNSGYTVGIGYRSEHYDFNF